MNSGRWLELRYGQTNAEKMKNKNKYSVLIVAILSLTGCWTRQGKTVSGTVPLTLTDSLRKLVTVDTVQIRERTSELLLNGKVAFDQDRIAPVPVPFAGVVEEVVPELGDYVRKGETLAVIRSGEAAEAEKQYVDAVQGLAVAERNQRTSRRDVCFGTGFGEGSARSAAVVQYGAGGTVACKRIQDAESCGGGELPTCSSCLGVCCRTQHQPQYAGTG